MIGIIPSGSKTYEIIGDFTCTELIEGKLYYHPDTKRLFYYSTKVDRSNPDTGYFPVWNGVKTFTSNFSNVKYFDKDAIVMDINKMSKNINKAVADDIRYKHRKCDNDEILKPPLRDGDNMFTQCIKGVISALDVTIVDLVDMSNPKMTQKAIENYYSALNKITFMRIEKWKVWLDNILHMGYVLEVFSDDKRLVKYEYPKDKFDTGIVKYNDITNTKDDPFKKIVKLLMIMKNINKKTLQSDCVDDYTINNMMTTLNGTKALSAQLFSRFIRMANMSYTIRIYDKGKEMFEYKE